MNEIYRTDLRAEMTIRLEGPAVHNHRIALQDLVLFGQELQTAVNRVARVLLGQSVSAQSGRTPAEIEQACALEVVALRPGSLELLLDLPQNRQLTFTDDLGEQSLQHLVQGIGSVGQLPSTLPRGFDRGVADALVSGGRLFDRGISKISLSLRTPTGRITSTYTPEVRQTLQSYSRPQRTTDNLATIEGKLLMGDFKDTSLKCRIDPPIGGRSITCTFDESQKSEVLRALTRYVRVVGEAVEQEGQLQTLRIRNIEILDDPTSEDAPYLREPVTAYPFFNPPRSLEELAAEQGVSPVTDFNSLRGDFWPEDEPVEDFISALRHWRQEDGYRSLL